MSRLFAPADNLHEPHVYLWARRSTHAGPQGSVISCRLRSYRSRRNPRWVLEESTRLAIKLVDEYGIESVEEVVYRFESVADRPSSATITQPESNRTVLPTAVINVVGEGRDDVGLACVTIEQERWTPAGADGT